MPGARPDQKSLTRPFRSQSPYRVGSGPFGPPISFGSLGAGAGFGSGGGTGFGSLSIVSVMTTI
jgi:hypothetical protein